MRRAKILQSGAFRLSLLLALIFAAGSLSLLWLMESSISHYAEQALASSLQSEAATLSSEYHDGGQTALLATLKRHRTSTKEQQFLYSLLSSSGEELLNDFGAATPGLGWSTVWVADDGAPPAREGFEELRSLGLKLSDGSQLVVATDAYDVQDLRRKLILVTILGGLTITVTALMGGYFVGGLFMRRLDKVNASVDRIMAGDLRERLPTIGISREFDLLSINLNRMLDRISSLMEGLRQVTTDIAHDLRTPLGRLRQHLETTRGSGSIERYDSGVEMALTQTDEILAIFHALLRIGVIEGGVGRRRFTTVDISEVMNRVCLAYQPVAEDEGKTLIVHHEPNATVLGDSDLLAQLFTNLFDNALNHTPRGTRIESHLVVRDGVAMATIRDNGPGIPASERENVLGRFYRLDRSRNLPGSGLGLALVAAISALHDAHLTLEDNLPGLCIKLAFAHPAKLASKAERDQ